MPMETSYAGKSFKVNNMRLRSVNQKSAKRIESKEKNISIINQKRNVAEEHVANEDIVVPFSKEDELSIKSPVNVNEISHRHDCKDFPDTQQLDISSGMFNSVTYKDNSMSPTRNVINSFKNDVIACVDFGEPFDIQNLEFLRYSSVISLENFLDCIHTDLNHNSALHSHDEQNVETEYSDFQPLAQTTKKNLSCISKSPILISNFCMKSLKKTKLGLFNSSHKDSTDLHINPTISCTNLNLEENYFNEIAKNSPSDPDYFNTGEPNLCNSLLHNEECNISFSYGKNNKVQNISCSADDIFTPLLSKNSCSDTFTDCMSSNYNKDECQNDLLDYEPDTDDVCENDDFLDSNDNILKEFLDEQISAAVVCSNTNDISVQNSPPPTVNENFIEDTFAYNPNECHNNFSPASVTNLDKLVDEEAEKQEDSQLQSEEAATDFAQTLVITASNSLDGINSSNSDDSESEDDKECSFKRNQSKSSASNSFVEDDISSMPESNQQSSDSRTTETKFSFVDDANKLDKDNASTTDSAKLDKMQLAYQDLLLYYGSKGYCRKYLRGQKCYSYCKYIHRTPPALENAKSYDHEVQHIPFDSVFASIKKACADESLDRAFKEAETVVSNKGVSPDTKNEAILLLLRTSVKLNIKDYVMFSFSLIKEYNLLNPKLCYDFIETCSRNPSDTYEVVVRFLRECYVQNIELAPGVVDLAFDIYDAADSVGFNTADLMKYDYSYHKRPIDLNRLNEVLKLCVEGCNTEMIETVVFLLKKLPLHQLSVIPKLIGATFIKLLENTNYLKEDIVYLKEKLRVEPSYFSKPVSSTLPNKNYVSHRSDVFENNLAERSDIKSLIENELWNKVAELFEFSVAKQDFSVVHSIHKELNIKDVAERYHKFLEAITKNKDNLDDLPAPCIYLLGQIGTALLLETYTKKNFKVAYDILHSLHWYDINYNELQLCVIKGEFNAHPLNDLPLFTAVFPSYVGLIAVDICLALQKPLEAYKIFQDFSWIKIENLNEGLRSDMIRKRIDLLRNLAIQLRKEKVVHEIIDVVKNLLESVKQDFPEIPHDIHKDVSNIYNNCLADLINKNALNEADQLYEHIVSYNWLDVKPTILRALVIAAVENGREFKVKQYFESFALMGIYSVQIPSATKYPRILRLPTNLTTSEMPLVINHFFKQFFPLLQEKTPKTSFEQWFSLKINLIEKVNEANPHLKCLHNLSTNVKDAKKRLFTALESMKNPELKVVLPETTENELNLHPDSVYKKYIEWNEARISNKSPVNELRGDKQNKIISPSFHKQTLIWTPGRSSANAFQVESKTEDSSVVSSLSSCSLSNKRYDVKNVISSCDEKEYKIKYSNAASKIETSPQTNLVEKNHSEHCKEKLNKPSVSTKSKRRYMNIRKKYIHTKKKDKNTSFSGKSFMRENFTICRLVDGRKDDQKSSTDLNDTFENNSFYENEEDCGDNDEVVNAPSDEEQLPLFHPSTPISERITEESVEALITTAKKNSSIHISPIIAADTVDAELVTHPVKKKPKISRKPYEYFIDNDHEKYYNVSNPVINKRKTVHRERLLQSQEISNNNTQSFASDFYTAENIDIHVNESKNLQRNLIHEKKFLQRNNLHRQTNHQHFKQSNETLVSTGSNSRISRPSKRHYKSPNQETQQNISFCSQNNSSSSSTYESVENNKRDKSPDSKSAAYKIYQFLQTKILQKFNAMGYDENEYNEEIKALTRKLTQKFYADNNIEQIQGVLDKKTLKLLPDFAKDNI